ncbi:MAG: beta-lactamase family protein [Pirellulaceae bacterium]|nr:beta-lactamase family protein [Pirellulaceae bacterium]
MQLFISRSCLFVILQLGLGAPAAEPVRLPHVVPGEAGLSAEKLQGIDAIVQEGLDQKKMPGCVVLVGRRDKIVLLKAYGKKRLEPAAEPMTTDTVFDVASLTKPIATATSVMILVDQGKLKLEEPVAIYLPEFAANNKEKVTVRQLLVHVSGLIPDNSIKDYDDGAHEALKRVFALKLQTSPGERFAYSDMNYVVLGELIKKLAGKNVHEFSQEHVFQPLGMRETTYMPGDDLKRRAAPTQQREGKWMQGEVHDPRAWKLGGIAGHAGLFSTAEDLAIYASMMLRRGEQGGTRILSEDAWKQMTSPNKVPTRRNKGAEYKGLRGLGWDMKTGYSINRGESFSPAAFGHGGFTGTSIWIDPEKDLFLIFLSNRVHPDGKGLVNPLIGRIGTVVGE